MDNETTELIKKAQSGDDRAFTQLYEMYVPLIKSKSSEYHSKCPNAGFSPEDFETEANLAFYSAVKNYKLGSKVTFGLYSKICIKNKLISFLRKTGKKSKVKEDPPESAAETQYIRKAEAESVIREAEKRLSRYEKRVFDLYTESKKTYREIAKEVGKSEKSVDNAMFRIRQKLRDLNK